MHREKLNEAKGGGKENNCVVRTHKASDKSKQTRWNDKTKRQTKKINYFNCLSSHLVTGPSEWHTHTETQRERDTPNRIVIVASCVVLTTPFFLSFFPFLLVYFNHLHLLPCAWHSSCFPFRIECVKRSTTKCHADYRIASSNDNKQTKKDDEKLNENKITATTANDMQAHTHQHLHNCNVHDQAKWH